MKSGFRSVLPFLSAIISCTTIVAGQNLPILKPEIGSEHIYTKKEQIVWDKAIDNLSKTNSNQIDYDNLPIPEKQMVDSLETGSGPVTDAGDTWSDCGEPYKVIASSYKANRNGITYKPENVIDFNLLSAWIPDAKSKRHKALNFYFKPLSPRVNEIIIYNGYIKNKELWKANSRVKTMKLYINDFPKVILQLEDNTASQSFKIDPVQSIDSTKDLILTLEIIDVYKGNKYDDVAISEINFDGLDFHCFGRGTRIAMADGTRKKIEDIKYGDHVLSYDFQIKAFVEAEVSDLIIARHTYLYTIQLEKQKLHVSTTIHFGL
jgi:hypothetical protein